MVKVAEYFTLRDASSTAARIPETGRKEIAGALAVGRQKAEAAEALWSNGHAAEGLRLAVEALRATLDAAPTYARALGGAARRAVPAPTVKDASDGEIASGADEAEADRATEAGVEEAAAPTDAEPTAAKDEEAAAAKDEEAAAAKPEEPAAAKAEEPAATKAEEPAASKDEEPAVSKDDAPAAPTPTWRDVLAERGVSAETQRMIADAEEKARTHPLPRLDPEVSAAHTDLYQSIARARLEVDRALSYAAMSPRDLAWTKIARIATASVLAVLLLVGLVMALRTPVAVTAEASATFGNSPQFGPPNVLDGNADSEWLLPDRATGWVEARLSPPRHVARVTLLNAKNPPHFDRATREYRLELYSSGRVLRSIDGELTELSRDPEPVTHDVDLDGVDRVRFVVRSSHNLGGGLAEMTIEE